MISIQVSLIAFVDDSFPGWVRAVFNDAHGKEWSIIEKIPVVTTEFLDETSDYPAVGFVAGNIISRSVIAGRKAVTIDLSQPVGTATEDGQEVFDVFEEQILEA